MLLVLLLSLLTVCWKTGVSCKSQKTGSFPILAYICSSSNSTHYAALPEALVIEATPEGRVSEQKQ